MESRKYVYKAEHRPDGFYAVVKEESTDEKVFEQKCISLEEAVQMALREFHRIIDK